VTLAEMAFGGGLGFDVDLARTGLVSVGSALAAEGASRFVVEVSASEERAFERTLRGVPCERLGEVTGDGAWFRWNDRELTHFGLDPLYQRWHDGLGLPG